MSAPRIELHLHLEGAAPPAFVRDLAARKRRDLSGIFDDRGAYRWQGFADFLRVYEAAASVIGSPEDHARLLRIVLAFQIRHEIKGEWFLIAGGVLSILLGGFMFAMPQAGLITLVWLIGFYAVAFGALFVLLALRLRKLGNKVDSLA